MIEIMSLGVYVKICWKSYMNDECIFCWMSSNIFCMFYFENSICWICRVWFCIVLIIYIMDENVFLMVYFCGFFVVGNDLLFFFFILLLCCCSFFMEFGSCIFFMFNM